MKLVKILIKQDFVEKNKPKIKGFFQFKEYSKISNSKYPLYFVSALFKK